MQEKEMRANSEGIRINKYIAECGVCSRRDADVLIAEGRVSVNGVTVTNGAKVSGSETICINGKQISGRNEKVVYAFYKPVGITCTERDPFAQKKVTDCIKIPVRVTYAGRLDKESEGLLLMTNDGDLIDRLMRGANRHEKEYVVKVNKEITDAFLVKMQQGVYLKELQQTTRPCEVKKEGKYTFRIVLTQGLNRQIRRMCKTLGYEVKELKRVRINGITLGKLTPGQYRLLSEDERKELYASVLR